MVESSVAYEAIADPIRRGILDLLRRADLTAGRIASHFPVSRPAVSRHLKVLRRAGLVRTERRGRLQVYRLDALPLGEVSKWVQEYERFWTEGLTSFKRHLEEDASTVPMPGSSRISPLPRDTERRDGMVTADEIAGAISLEVEISARPERVFEALASANQIRHLLPEFRQFELDARLGGSYRFSREDPDGRRVAVEGEIVEFDPPRVMAMTWRWEDSTLPETLVRFELEQVPGGTKLSLRHTGFGPGLEEVRAQHEEHWKSDLVLFKSHLESA